MRFTPHCDQLCWYSSVNWVQVVSMRTLVERLSGLSEEQRILPSGEVVRMTTCAMPFTRRYRLIRWPEQTSRKELLENLSLFELEARFWSTCANGAFGASSLRKSEQRESTTPLHVQYWGKRAQFLDMSCLTVSYVVFPAGPSNTTVLPLNAELWCTPVVRCLI